MPLCPPAARQSRLRGFWFLVSSFWNGPITTAGGSTNRWLSDGSLLEPTERTFQLSHAQRFWIVPTRYVGMGTNQGQIAICPYTF
jgi:hypothetical protein